MNRPRLKRGLKITWTAFCGLVFVLLIALWVRSYWYPEDIIVWRTTSAQERITPPEWYFGNMPGWIGFDYYPDTSPFATREWEYESYPAEEIRRILPSPGFLGFYVGLSPGPRDFYAPHWFLVLLSAAFAAVPWIRQLKWHFSLRTLLIATTLVAVVLGLIVWAASN